MVRLNEPPVLGDTVEALKRRFIRQNREIARANSTQSAKIRGLECETSRLLSENIALREENIKLQKALDEAEGKHGSVNIPFFKERFESKMHELSELLGELSTSSTAKDNGPTPGKLRRKAARQSLLQRMRPTPEQMAENAAAEGRLAPIFEDKVTLEDNFDGDVRISIPEIADITNSPELGPPPEAHVDEGDPVKLPFARKETLNESPSKERDAPKGTERQSSFLSSNLETRKRRREVASVQNGASEPSPETTAASPEKSGPGDVVKESVQIGAKRKLGSREEESRFLVKSSSQDNLRLKSRSNLEGGDVRRPKSHINLSSIGESMSKVQSKPTPHLTAVQGRRALGEKSVNTDPVVSPGKPRQMNRDKPQEPSKEPAARSRERLQSKEKSTIRQIRPLKPEADATKPAVEELRVLPKTPAVDDDDVFSPTSSHPSTIRTESRDTPPPGELQNGSADAASRPSRRQRSAVSYAEPSLRDKMRRPGKEMVDAISGLQRSRASISELPRDDHFFSEESKPRHASIHLDDAGGTGGFKSKEPTSPLTSRSTSGHPGLESGMLPAATLADRRRRTTVAAHSRSTSAEESRSTGSQDTISALISSSQKKLARVGGASFPVDGEASSLTESLSVFDLHLSSPPKSDTADESAWAENKTRAVRVGKRHSSVSEGISKASKEREQQPKRAAEEMSGDEGRVDIGGMRRAERAERRRSMMV